MTKNIPSNINWANLQKRRLKMLVLHRKKGESLVINDNIKITIVDVSGEKVKIAIEAPKEIPILRTELIIAAETNREAASSDEKLSKTSLKNLLGISKK